MFSVHFLACSLHTRLAYKSSSYFFPSAKRELYIFYELRQKASEREGALRPTTGTGNEKPRTLTSESPLACWRPVSGLSTEKLEMPASRLSLP